MSYVILLMLMNWYAGKPMFLLVKFKLIGAAKPQHRTVPANN